MVVVEQTNATNTVNGLATYRHGEYFQKALTVNNSTGPAYQPITTIASLTNSSITNVGNVLLPPVTQSFQYDADGNLTNDSVWSYGWDGENRLIQLETASAVPLGAKKKLTFEYDYLGRRIAKRVYQWAGSAWNLTNELHFAYDGWNLIAELNSQNCLYRTYMWGLDLSGKFEGAGGIGGLLASTHNDLTDTYHFYCYDGNGNVMALFDPVSGYLSAQYEYGPFGEPIRVSGPAAKANPFRWSTKYWDEETDMVNYGYRYYIPSLGRWANRDPMGIAGGMNLYGFVANNCLNFIDALGLELVSFNLMTANRYNVRYVTKYKLAEKLGWAYLDAFQPQETAVFDVDPSLLPVEPQVPILHVTDLMPTARDVFGAMLTARQSFLDRYGANPIRAVDPRVNAQAPAVLAYMISANAGNRLSGKIWSQDADDNDITAYQLYYQFVFGTGKSSHEFDESSVMGGQMVQAPFVQAAIDKAVNQARQGNLKGFEINNDISTVPEGDYVSQFLLNAEGLNPALAFQGSIGGDVIMGKPTLVNGVNTLPITIKLSDASSAESATRLPPIIGGYVPWNPLRAAFTNANPFGENAPFRTINIKYELHINVPLPSP